jgi:RHS repeat-associated protein
LLSVGNSTANPPVDVEAYYHTDLLGSIRAVTDAAGNLTTAARHDYYAFGEEHPQAQHPQAPLTGERQRFAGKQVDPETYLQYFEARYFANRTGRFTSPDPVLPAWARTRPQGWQRYAYAMNNPLRFVDPSGLEPESALEPMLESSTSASGFSLEEFNAWAEDLYEINMQIYWESQQAQEAQCGQDQRVTPRPPTDQDLVNSVAARTQGVETMVLLYAGLWSSLDFVPLVTSIRSLLGLGGTAAVRYVAKGFAEGELEGHFVKHAGEWGAEGITKAGYLRRAQTLLGRNAGGDILGHVRSNGDVLRYNQRTNEFAVGTADGTIRTFFRPGDGIAYWRQQVGR